MTDARRLYWPLVGVLVVAALVRFTNLDWDELHHTHPDERYVLFVASSMRLPERPVDLLVAGRSTLNPFRAPPKGERRPYPYGHLPLYAMLAARPALSPLLGDAFPDRFDQLTLAGRGLSALYDTLTVLVVGLLARRVYGRRAGWLAAAFAALAVMHIQQAHFATVDAALAFFVTLALWFMVQVAAREGGTLRDSLLAGLCAGLAVGSKATGWLLAAPLVVAHLRRTDGMWHVDGWLWAALPGMGLAFALTNPYAVLELPLYVRDISTQAAMARGQLDVAFVRQYEGTLPVWYGVSQQAQWGLGLPLTLACYAGLGRATWKNLARQGDRRCAPLLAWAWLNLILLGGQFVKFPRYILPVTPVLFVFAAGWLGRAGRLRGWLAALILVAAGLRTLAWARMYAQPHPWVAASLWIYETLPPGTTIAVEHTDDALPLDLDDADRQLVAALRYDQRSLDPYSSDGDLAGVLGDLAASEYLVVASNRLYGTLPRLEGKYPLAAAMYRHLFSGHLGFTLERAFTRYPNWPGVAFVDDTFTRSGLSPPPGFEAALPERVLWLGYADESFTVYDHPLVMVFRNETHLSAKEMQAVITSEP